jgi:hypothetical protein
VNAQPFVGDSERHQDMRDKPARREVVETDRIVLEVEVRRLKGGSNSGRSADGSWTKRGLRSDEAGKLSFPASSSQLSYETRLRPGPPGPRGEGARRRRRPLCPSA